MFAIILAGLAGLAVSIVASVIAAQWAYLLTAPLLGSALGLATACALATRPGLRAREAADASVDQPTDALVIRLRQAGARLARYETREADMSITRRSASS